VLAKLLPPYSLTVREIALEFGISEDTVRSWRARYRVTDRSHTGHWLQTMR